MTVTATVVMTAATAATTTTTTVFSPTKVVHSMLKINK